LAGCGGRGPTSSGPRPEGPVFDVGAARRDRARPGPRRLHPGHRGPPRPVTVDGVAGAARNAEGLGAIGPPPRTHWPITAPPDRSWASWSRTWNCVAWWRRTWPRSAPPEQIAGRLKVEFPDQPDMQVSTETIYQSLYVQSRGALKHELTRCCGLVVRCGGRRGRSGNGRTGSRT
jgi:hypothetical protein